MAGAYTANPDYVSTPDVPDGWNILWPYPGPYPPGYEPPTEPEGGVPQVDDDNPPDEPPDKIEQDWEITLSGPDPTINSPQIYIYGTPLSGWGSYYCGLLLNYADTPEYSAGGMQFQLWNGESVLDTQEFASGFQMNPGDTSVTFTLRMQVQDNIATPDDLKFSIHYGQSDTWGSFGTGGFDLEVTSPVSDLSTYRTSISTQGSEVGFGGNRVPLIKITEVRYYKDDVLIGRDSNEHIIHHWP